MSVDKVPVHGKTAQEIEDLIAGQEGEPRDSRPIPGLLPFVEISGLIHGNLPPLHQS